MKTYQCEICQSFGNEVLFINEKMFGTEKPFKYIHCSTCDCLQIVEKIEDISEFYPQDYYSFQNQQNIFRKIKSLLENYLLKYVALMEMGYPNLIGKIAMQVKEHYEYCFKWLSKLDYNKDAMILDVGCGGGELLKRLTFLGYNNLYGVDPFIEKDIIKHDYKIEKRHLYELDGEYDLIMLHHSFEHMEKPHNVLSHLRKILKNDGTLLIRIPIIDSLAYKEYVTNWFQLDAPRHLFLYSIKSMEFLLNEHNLYIKEVVYDSTSKQFLYSEKYKNGYALNDLNYNFSRKKSKYYRNLARQLNEVAQGDQVCLFIKKINA